MEHPELAQENGNGLKNIQNNNMDSLDQLD
jgi:hypothetical protein